MADKYVRQVIGPRLDVQPFSTSVRVGDPVYWDATNTVWEQADASDATKLPRFFCSAVHSFGAAPRGDLALGIILEDVDAPYTADAVQYLSETAGAVTETRPITAGAVGVALGRAVTTSKVALTVHPGFLGASGYFPNGTAAAPSITFESDPDSGWYRIGANNIGLALNGAVELNITTAAFSPGANSGLTLGTASLQWTDLFLVTGGVIHWNDVDTITHTASTLTLAGIATLVGPATLTLFNTATTTLNFGGAATTIAIGAAASVTTWTGRSFTLTGANGINDTSLTVANTSNVAEASDAILTVSVGGGTSTGDPQVRLTVTGVQTWYMGVDNSPTADTFVIGRGTAVGTTPSLSAIEDVISLGPGLVAVTLSPNVAGYAEAQFLSISARYMTLNMGKAEATEAGAGNPLVLFNFGGGTSAATWVTSAQIRVAGIGATDTTISFHTSATFVAATRRMTILGGGTIITGTGGSVANVNVAGAIVAVGGIAFTDVLNAWIDDATNGNGTVVHYIGNNTINTTAPSDERLKQVYGPTLLEAMPLLRRIEMIDYAWLDQEMGEGRRFGWGARQIATVLPELVHKPVNGEPWHVLAQNFMPYIVKGLQELDDRLTGFNIRRERVEGRVSSLERRYESLGQRVGRLETELAEAKAQLRGIAGR